VHTDRFSVGCGDQEVHQVIQVILKIAAKAHHEASLAPDAVKACHGKLINRLNAKVHRKVCKCLQHPGINVSLVDAALQDSVASLCSGAAELFPYGHVTCYDTNNQAIRTSAAELCQLIPIFETWHAISQVPSAG